MIHYFLVVKIEYHYKEESCHENRSKNSETRRENNRQSAPLAGGISGRREIRWQQSLEYNALFLSADKGEG